MSIRQCVQAFYENSTSDIDIFVILNKNNSVKRYNIPTIDKLYGCPLLLFSYLFLFEN